jgi:hypothetical protein
MFKIHQAVHVIGKIVGQRSHDEKEEKQSENMACDLDNGLEVCQQMRPQKNQDDENAERLKEKETIPEDIGRRVHKFPFKKGAHGEIDRIPKTNEHVRPFPDLRYVVNPLQSL